jgi:hypothetical protein
MSGFVFRIDAGQSHHWDYAKSEGFWDFNLGHSIRAGDECYFLVNNGQVVGRAHARGPRAPIGPADQGPWAEGRTYHYRVQLHGFIDYAESVGEPEIVEALGRGLNPRSSSVLDNRQLDRMRGLLEAANVPSLSDVERRAELEALGYDLREFDLRAIARRMGQPAFRQALIEAYGGRCAVTGTATPSVLEAAHIMPHMGAQTNVVENGLLLRSDIHTLFDRRLLTVTPDLLVRIHPELTAQEYRRLDRRPLLDVGSQVRPRADVLSQHNERCGWLAE